MGRVKVKKSDKERVLLTEVLPYEVPIPFSNEGLYKFARRPKNEQVPPLITKILFEQNSKSLLPYSYRIIKDSDSTRTLSIMHPQVQLKFVKFYEDYDSLIISLCSKSRVSIRYPKKVASHFYVRNSLIKKNKIKDSGVEIERASFEIDQGYSSSYFTYKDFDFLYKFYDSYKFHRLEKKFKHLLRFDIAKCFHNIYTHSIAWAIKSKEFAKANTSTSSFENKFDKLMQWSNYNETNGIIIGPETSRIFAEIILQKIENNVLRKLLKTGKNGKKLPLKIDSDYSLRRYVDDYFVFTNDPKTAERVKKAFQEELEYFKLSINEFKTERFEVPFITGITIARIDLEELFNNFFNRVVVSEWIEEEKEEEEEPNQIKSVHIKVDSKPYNTSNRLIRDVKSIIKRNKVTYQDVTGMTLSRIRNKLVDLLDDEQVIVDNPGYAKDIINPLLIVLDVLFFIVSMDSRTRVTVLLTQIIVVINRFLNNPAVDHESKRLIAKRIFDGVRDLLDLLNQRDEPHLESLNMLISLVNISNTYSFDKSKFIRMVVGKEESFVNLDYFETVVLLHFIGESSECDGSKQKIVEQTLKKFSEDKEWKLKTEMVLLFFDFIACPHIDNEFKNKLISLIYFQEHGTNMSKSKIGELRNYVTRKGNWFIDWNTKDINLEYMLLKKEYSPPYSS
ncbi:antiviral reverse transcriptase Drt3b [Roseivirga thermotolerans]|uniref:antiviral reverse transcriptase Drt3b n=1 Tax=Roseivirga thermotolerans TaxID=1758176 RepID=UPI00273D2DF2|nr:antiviral reverse transcriptase Drt3b [Roseivirga thermotolerans]